MSNHNATALLHNNNLRNDQLLHRGPSILHYQSPAVMQSWVNFFFSWRCESTLRIFYFLICQLLLHFNVSIELLFSNLFCRAGVGCRFVDCAVNHWIANVSWVWRIPKHDAAVSHDSASYYIEAPDYYTRTNSRATTPKPRSNTLPRATIRRPWIVASWLTSTTSTRNQSVTQLQMPRQVTTPWLPSTTLLPAISPKLQLLHPKNGQILQRSNHG
jgi:hypothetical protein